MQRLRSRGTLIVLGLLVVAALALAGLSAVLGGSQSAPNAGQGSLGAADPQSSSAAAFSDCSGRFEIVAPGPSSTTGEAPMPSTATHPAVTLPSQPSAADLQRAGWTLKSGAEAGSHLIDRYVSAAADYLQFATGADRLTAPEIAADHAACMEQVRTSTGLSQFRGHELQAWQYPHRRDVVAYTMPGTTGQLAFWIVYYHDDYGINSWVTLAVPLQTETPVSVLDLPSAFDTDLSVPSGVQQEALTMDGRRYATIIWQTNRPPNPVTPAPPATPEPPSHPQITPTTAQLKQDGWIKQGSPVKGAAVLGRFLDAAADQADPPNHPVLADTSTAAGDRTEAARDAKAAYQDALTEYLNYWRPAKVDELHLQGVESQSLQAWKSNRTKDRSLVVYTGASGHVVALTLHQGKYTLLAVPSELAGDQLTITVSQLRQVGFGDIKLIAADEPSGAMHSVSTADSGYYEVITLNRERP